MWPIKSKAQRDREGLLHLGRCMNEGIAEGIRRAEAGEAHEPLSPEAVALMSRIMTRSGLLWDVDR